MIELLRKRRSIRKFKNQRIEQEKIDILQEALLRSPTSRNIRPWEFIFIDDRKLLKKLSTSKPHGAKLLENAVLGIVVLGDETKSDVWIEDCSIASILVQLTAESIGIGSCWIQIRNRMYDENKTAEQYIKKLLNIPENYKVESIIAMGYPDETKQGIPFEGLPLNKIHTGEFKQNR